MTEEAMAAEFRAKTTPQVVNMAFDGCGGHAITYYLPITGQYYTVTAKPDFEKIEDDAKISRAVNETDRLVKHYDDLDGRQSERGYLPAEQRCELELIRSLVTNGEVTFGDSFQRHLKHIRLEGLEHTNNAYYENLKAFTAAWLRLKEFMAGE